MTSCAVPNCNLYSKVKFQSPNDKSQLNLWKKILQIEQNEFVICDQHFEDRFLKMDKVGVTSDAYPTLYLKNGEIESIDSCLCCLKNKNYEDEDFFITSEEIKQIIEDLAGCEIPSGLICIICHSFINQILIFRDQVQKSQQIRSRMTDKGTINTPDKDFSLKLENNSDDENEEQYVLVNYPIEQSIEAAVESSGNLEEQLDIKAEKSDFSENIVIETSNCPEIENYAQNTIIKVEPIEDEEFQEVQIESSVNYVKIEPEEDITDTFNIPSSSASQFSISVNSKKPSQKLFTVSNVEVPAHNFKCQYCADRFPSREEVVEHIQEKHNFNCPNCSITFKYKIQLIQHHVSEHLATTNRGKSKAGIYPCLICKMKFTYKDKLADHMMDQHSNVMKVLDEKNDDKSRSHSSNNLSSSESDSLSSRIKRNFKSARLNKLEESLGTKKLKTSD